MLGVEVVIFFVLILGFLVSTLSVVAGIGGGAFYTPVLHFIVGLEVTNALAVASSGILTSSLIASIIYLRRRIAELKIAIPILIGQMLSSSISTYLTTIVPKTVIYVVLAFILIFNSTRILFGNRNVESRPSRKYSYVEFLLLGLFVGFIAPLAGIGGGVIIVPSLISIYGVDSKVASATSLVVIASSYSLVTTLHIYLGNMLVEYAIPLITGIIFGSLLGTKLHISSKPVHIRFIVGVIALIFGLYTVYKLIQYIV